MRSGFFDISAILLYNEKQFNDKEIPMKGPAGVVTFGMILLFLIAGQHHFRLVRSGKRGGKFTFREQYEYGVGSR
jgi:hypothetical protein